MWNSLKMTPKSDRASSQMDHVRSIVMPRNECKMTYSSFPEDSIFKAGNFSAHFGLLVSRGRAAGGASHHARSEHTAAAPAAPEHPHDTVRAEDLR